MKYYCIGIKGTGMSTLAQILYDLGNEVSGYDDAEGYKFTQDGLEKRGIKIYYGHDHDIDKDTIVTYSVAFSKDHPEMKRVQEMGLQMKAYGEIMGDVIDQFDTIGVSGTHGKTTTSSIIRHILEENGGCNYFIGSGDGMATRDNKYYVVESDEFNRHFLYYHPKYAIIASMEEEHMEVYKDIDDIRETFEKFANQTKELVIANGDNPQIRRINFKTPVMFFGFNDDNDIVIKNMNLATDGGHFDLEIKGEMLGHFDIPLYGKHMVMNAASAIAMCNYLGVSYDNIYKALSNFQNAKRRMETTVIDDTTIIDDYAHHPTEIKVTLEAVRQKYPDKKIVVVFRPNTYSRFANFKDEFIDALQVADKVYLTEVQANRERAEDYPGISSKLIVDAIDGAEMVEEETIDKLNKEIGNVVVFMGCADNSHLIAGFEDLLKK
ncbi:MAG: UDP-N-acetylmuramate--L-alanine ligase [Bacilli bacterium]|nr:UDP-N-acetylmuramate--L-alanine ligase [Bacilli bacterium]